MCIQNLLAYHLKKEKSSRGYIKKKKNTFKLLYLKNVDEY